ncbi:MAG: CpsD/CapB family tyrosine-protein kinase [Sarcina sp.]
MFIVEKEPKSIPTEAYKNLRTNIQYSSYDEQKQIIVVTSSQPQEGKSTTSGNIALSFAQDGKNVILIDCDLRKPSIHKKFMLSNEAGVSEVILGIKSIKDCIHQYKKNFHILTSGTIPPNPSEMLGSENMKRLLNVLKEKYDYIILDAPPILAVTDAQVLSTRADGVVFVVRAGKTKKDNILQAKKELEKVNAKILGTILNGFDTKDSKNQYYYYYNEDK